MVIGLNVLLLLVYLDYFLGIFTTPFCLNVHDILTLKLENLLDEGPVASSSLNLHFAEPCVIVLLHYCDTGSEDFTYHCEISF